VLNLDGHGAPVYQGCFMYLRGGGEGGGEEGYDTGGGCCCLEVALCTWKGRVTEGRGVISWGTAGCTLIATARPSIRVAYVPGERGRDTGGEGDAVGDFACKRDHAE
jgi:hypothetical protein